MAEALALPTFLEDDPRWAFEPRGLPELYDLADRLAKSRAVPGDSGNQPQYQNQPNNIVAAAMLGRTVGLGVMHSLQAFYIVNGRPSLWGDAPLAIVRGSGLLEKI